MKKTILLFFLMLMSAYNNAQSTTELDQRNGFKDFKLGSPLTQWSGELEFQGESTGIKTYIYQGDCCAKIFDYQLKEIKLLFSENILVGIRLTTDFFQEPYGYSGGYTKWRRDDFENINNAFTQLFGGPTDFKSKDMSFIWAGNKTILISTYEYLGVKSGDRQQIIIMSKKLFNKNTNDGF